MTTMHTWQGPGRFPRRPFLVLWLGCVLVAPLIVPFQRIRAEQATVPQQLPDSLWLMTAGQMAIVGLIAVGIGLPLARRIGCGAPFVERALYGTPSSWPLRSIVPPALWLAVLTALAAYAIDAAFYSIGLTTPAAEIHARVPAVKGEIVAGFLASITAGYVEEIVWRLFFMSLFVWIAWRLTVWLRGGNGGLVPPAAAFWVGGAAATLLFAMAHVPLAADYGDQSSLVALRTVLIIAPPGMAFGWLYWRHGLEAAVLSHVTIDLIVHVAKPALDRLA